MSKRVNNKKSKPRRRDRRHPTAVRASSAPVRHGIQWAPAPVTMLGASMRSRSLWAGPRVPLWKRAARRVAGWLGR